MNMNYVAKQVSDKINVTPRHPLVNFAYLLGTVVLVSMIIFVLLGFIADWLATRIKPETESQIGQMLLNTMSEEEIQEDRRIQYLGDLLNALPVADEKIRIPLTIHLFDTIVINAAIMSGGHVLINTGLLQAVKSENELAFVLAHELGHFQTKDPVRSLGRSLVFLSVLMAIGLGTSQSGGMSEIVPMTGHLTGLHYSRKQETTADVYGLSRVVKYYGHGGNSLDFFTRIEEKGEEPKKPGKLSKVSQYFSTHPLSDKRIVKLMEVAKQNGWKMEGEITPLPEWLGCPNMEECESWNGE